MFIGQLPHWNLVMSLRNLRFWKLHLSVGLQMDQRHTDWTHVCRQHWFAFVIRCCAMNVWSVDGATVHKYLLQQDLRSHKFNYLF